MDGLSKKDNWITDNNQDLRDAIADDDDEIVNHLIEKEEVEEMTAVSDFEEDCMLEFVFINDIREAV